MTSALPYAASVAGTADEEGAAMGVCSHRRTAVLVVVGILVAFPAGVRAAGTFGDVPDGNVHHEAVRSVHEAGVTAGCAPGAYCPDALVRRDQMASFLDRLGALSGQEPVVRAATATTADRATTADSAGSADRATTADSATSAETVAGLEPGDLSPVAVVAGTEWTPTLSTGFADLPGATTDVTVPEGHQALLLLRFAAESACSGGVGICTVRLLVDGEEAEPAVGANFAFDSTDFDQKTSQSWQSHAMERVVGPLPSGTYTVTVQHAVSEEGVLFQLDNWLLVAEAKLVS